MSTLPSRPQPAGLWFALGTLVGVVIAAGAMGVAWGLSSGVPTDDGRLACSLIDRVDTAKVAAEDRDASMAELNRWAAAEVLAHNASLEEDRYEPVHEAIRTSRQAHTATFDVEDEQVTSELARARDLCGDL